MGFDKEQQRVYEWLNDDLRLPVFAEAYKSAADFIHKKPAGYISFVAHAGRDLMNRLASTVGGIQSKQVQYHQHVDKLLSEWQNEWWQSNDLAPGVVAKGHLIPIKVSHQSMPNNLYLD